MHGPGGLLLEARWRWERVTWCCVCTWTFGGGGVRCRRYMCGSETSNWGLWRPLVGVRACCARRQEFRRECVTCLAALDRIFACLAVRGRAGQQFQLRGRGRTRRRCTLMCVTFCLHARGAHSCLRGKRWRGCVPRARKPNMLLARHSAAAWRRSVRRPMLT